MNCSFVVSLLMPPPLKNFFSPCYAYDLSLSISLLNSGINDMWWKMHLRAFLYVTLIHYSKIFVNKKV